MKFKQSKSIVFLLSCFIASILMHLYSFEVTNYMTSPFSFIIILIPSLIASYYLIKDSSNNKDWIFNMFGGLLITIWPTIIIVLFFKYLFSFLS